MKPHHRLARIGTAVVLAAITVTLWASPATAHAALESSNPRDGQTLTELPQQVAITLNEPAKKPSYIAVLAPDGTRANSEDVVITGQTVASQVTAAAQSGTYTMSYRVISTDGHVVTGTFKFDVGPATTPSETASPAPGTSTPPSPSGSEELPGAAGDGIGGVLDNSASYVVLVFFAFTLVGLFLMVRAGLRNSGAEDE